MHRYLFVLGAPNDPFGALSSIARSRMDAAAAYYRAELGAGMPLTIVATGGHGDHFNRAPRPHRDYANDDLVRRSIPKTALVEDGFLSSNTVEDAFHISEFVTRHNIPEATVLTSTFHVDRCRLIFSCVMQSCRFSFHAAKDPPDLEPSVLAHERSAIAVIRNQGGVAYGAQFFPLPDEPTTKIRPRRDQ